MELRRKLLNSARKAILHGMKCLAVGKNIFVKHVEKNVDFKMDSSKTMDVIQLHLLKIEVWEEK